MRSTFLAVTAVLLVGVAAPTFAATKHAGQKEAARKEAPTYEACEALAVDRGVPPNQGPSTTFDAPFKSFMQACLAGKIPFDDKTAPVAKGSL